MDFPETEVVFNALDDGNDNMADNSDDRTVANREKSQVQINFYQS